MAELERIIEGRVVTWLKKNKIEHRKMNGLGNRSWPDRMICLPFAPFWIEFKKPGETLYPLQEIQIKKMLALGYDVEVHDDSEEAIAAIKKRAKTAPAGGNRRKSSRAIDERFLRR